MSEFSAPSGSSASGGSRPRRPTLLGKLALDSLAGAPDPAELVEAAHAAAWLLVSAGRDSEDPQVQARLVRLVDEVGLDTLADLWSQRPARSLPGALWRLYALREWVRSDPVGAAADYRAGCGAPSVPQVVAGAADPPTPEALLSLLDQVLHGVFAGELDVALERAGAFCRVVLAGRVRRADDLEATEPALARQLTGASLALQDTAEDLEAAALLWRKAGLV